MRAVLAVSRQSQMIAKIDTSVTAGPAPEITPPGLTIWPSDNTIPSIYSWYLGLQRELPSKFSVDLSYAGNHAVHLMEQRKPNAVPANTFVQYPNLSQSCSQQIASWRMS